MPFKFIQDFILKSHLPKLKIHFFQLPIKVSVKIQKKKCFYNTESSDNLLPESGKNFYYLHDWWNNLKSTIDCSPYLCKPFHVGAWRFSLFSLLFSQPPLYGLLQATGVQFTPATAHLLQYLFLYTHLETLPQKPLRGMGRICYWGWCIVYLVGILSN